MTLQETETKLAELNNHIAELLKERENVLKEWHIAFNMENQDEIICVAEGVGENKDDAYHLYLINGDSKMLACYIYCDYKKCSINDFYKQIDISMQLLNEVNGHGIDVPKLHRNLVYAKAMEIREHADRKIRFEEFDL